MSAQGKGCGGYEVHQGTVLYLALEDDFQRIQSRMFKPMRTGPTKQEKTTEIYFDEKDPTIFIRTHNTDLKNRLTAYSRKHLAVCKLTDVDQDTGCKEFEIERDAFHSG